MFCYVFLKLTKFCQPYNNVGGKKNILFRWKTGNPGSWYFFSFLLHDGQAEIATVSLQVLLVLLPTCGESVISRFMKLFCHPLRSRGTGIGSLHLSGHSVTAAVLRRTTEWTRCITEFQNEFRLVLYLHYAPAQRDKRVSWLPYWLVLTFCWHWKPSSRGSEFSCFCRHCGAQFVARFMLAVYSLFVLSWVRFKIARF